jgi:hypothetical protein
MNDCEVCQGNRACVECEGTGRCVCCESEPVESVSPAPAQDVKRITDNQLNDLNEKYGYFQHSDAQGDVSRAFADAVAEILASDYTANLEKWKQEAHDLLWNLAGCDAIASGWSKPREYSKDLARPALASVSRLAERAETAESELQQAKQEFTQIKKLQELTLQNEINWMRKHESAESRLVAAREALELAWPALRRCGYADNSVEIVAINKALAGVEGGTE